jgi:hypothetical protein
VPISSRTRGDLLLRQRDREPGVFVTPGEHNVTARAVTWAQILQDARHRLGFVRDSLAYSSTTDASMTYLRRVHGTYLPPRVAGDASGGYAADMGAASTAEDDTPEARCAIGADEWFRPDVPDRPERNTAL